MAQGYQKYSQAYRKSAINTIDQRKLIVMLYDGAVKFLGIAAQKMREKDYYESHINIVKGKSIVAELMASLNLEQGGDIAVNLQRVYVYMFDQLIEANMQKDPERVLSVIELLKELREAWKELEPPKPGEEKPTQAVATPNGVSPKINIQG